MLLDMAANAAAVAALVGKHPLLPAARLAAEDGGVTVHLHSGLGDFEAWREALHVPSGDVQFTPRDDGSSMCATTRFAGVPVRLIGYSGPVPQAAVSVQAVA